MMTEINEQTTAVEHSSLNAVIKGHQLDVDQVGITNSDLEAVFRIRHSTESTDVSLGSAPSRRRQFGYYPPPYYYEALIQKMVGVNTKWLDIGAGSDIFPANPRLAAILAERCSLLVGVDPSENVLANPYVHEHAQCSIEDYNTSHRFDLITLRMVAEHISNPSILLDSLKRLLVPCGRVVVFTVNLRAPITLISQALPFKLHYPIKRFFWGSKEEATFPIAYKMNTRRALKCLFQNAGFQEQQFFYVDDCCTFSRFHWLNYTELALWRGFKFLGMRYPENCLLAVYKMIR